MIETMPMQLPVNHIPLLMKPAATSSEDISKLSPPLIARSDDKTKDIRPWRLTPPLKKRHIRISVDDDSAPTIAPLKKKVAKIPIKKAKQPKVRFSRVIKTRALKKERYPLPNPTSMWYQNREYMEIDQESMKNIRALHVVRGDLTQLPASDYCLRGLEMKSSPHIHRLRRLRASITVRAVLDQQNYQRRLGLTDLVGESVARVSRQYTQQAQLRARELGVIDSIEATR